MGYLEKVKNKFANKPQVYNQFLDIMKDFKSQTINTEGVIERVKTLFKGNRHLILGFNQFLPPGYKIELPPEKKTTIEFNHAVQYVAKIKNRFREKPEIYGEFLDILHDYQANRTIDEVFQRVQKLFGGQPDLLDEFKYFLPAKAPSNRRGKKQSSAKKKAISSASRAAQRGGGGGSALHSRDDLPPAKIQRVRVTYPPGSEKDLLLLERIKSAIPRNSWMQLMKCLHLHTLGIVTRLELVTMVEDVMGERYPEYVDRFKNMISYDEWEESQRVTRERKNYYTFVASVDFTSCQQPTPSYRRIPGDIPLPSCSGRTPLCDQVLNNRCISIPTGSEDFSFKSTRKNQYEENLFKCEDERFELDMVIENNASAIRVLEPLEEKIEKMTPKEALAYKLPKSLDILHIRAIARMYGDHGYQIIDLLNKNPTVAIPIVLARMRQKDEEWRRVRVSMRDTWRKIAAQNYNKSLDHRSFYFKQEDKKRILPKNLISNLKEIHHYIFGASSVGGGGSGGSSSGKPSKQPDSDVLRALQGGKGPLFNYCMRFSFPDKSIHAEVYNTLVFALRSHSESDKQACLEFLSGFLHHFFNYDHSAATKGAAAGAAAAAAATTPEPAEALASSPANAAGKEGAGDKKSSSSSRKRKSGGKKSRKKKKKAPAAEANGMEVENGDEENDEDGESNNNNHNEEDADAEEAGKASGGGRKKRDSSPLQLKPTRLALETWEIDERVVPIRRHVRKSRLLFGTTSLYVLMRLHEMLYTRLHRAKELAYTHKNKATKAQLELYSKSNKRRTSTGGSGHGAGSAAAGGAGTRRRSHRTLRISSAATSRRRRPRRSSIRTSSSRRCSRSS